MIFIPRTDIITTTVVCYQHLSLKEMLNFSYSVLCLVTQLFATPWTLYHQAPLSIGILQARILEWVVIPSARGSSQPGLLHCGQILYHLSHQGSPKTLAGVSENKDVIFPPYSSS